MNLTKNPDLLDRLASSYALGTLRGGARRRFESLAREQAPVRAAALIWQSRMASINELQPQSPPDAVVWTRIDNLLRGEQQARVMAVGRQAAGQNNAAGGSSGTWLRSLLVWRGAAVLGAVATAFSVIVGVHLRDQMGGEIQQLQAKLLATPQIDYVAVLADDKSSASMLVTFDPRNKKLTLQRVSGYQESGDRSLQLWALPPSGGPKSLGVLGRDKLIRLTAGESDVHQVPKLAISLEPKGGVPSEGGPTGPVLFSGALIKKML
jgi:anti-sigma-K factor RskA